MHGFFRLKIGERVSAVKDLADGVSFLYSTSLVEVERKSEVQLDLQIWIPKPTIAVY